MEKVMVPKLRFPEFGGNWETKKVGECFKVNAGGDIDKEHVSEIKTDYYKYPIYANAEKNKGLYGYSDLYKVEAGTVTIAGRGVNIGIAHARDHRYFPIVRLLILKPLNREDIFFAEYLLNRLSLFVESTGVPQLTAPQISNYKITIPTLPEQQKIATFLGKVDEKISALEEKKRLLEQYKKGVMQQLFSQQIRFKDEDGNDFPDWEERKFSELYKFVSTNSLSREKLNYEEGEIRNIHYGDIHTKFRSHFQLNNEEVPFINNDVDISRFKPEAFCEVGDLIMADASEDYNDIGKAIEIMSLDGNRMVSGLHTFLAKPIQKQALGFMGHFMKSWLFRKQMMVIAQGTKVLSISTSRVGNLKVLTPSLPEQQKIATFLSAIDNKIAGVGEQLAQSRAFKKGLLQGMFV